MRPRADEVLTNVIDTFDEYVLPNVDESYAKSMAKVISGLLRHVQLRLAHEGQALYDDIAEMRSALGSVLELLEAPLAHVAGAEERAKEIRSVLDKVYRSPREYPTLESLTDEATELGTLLDGSNRLLLDLEEACGGDPRYRAVRDEIRAHVASQLQREAVWTFGAAVDPGL